VVRLLRQFFGLLNTSETNEDAVRESYRPYQSESAGLASLVLRPMQSHVDMTPANEDILNEFATEARRLKRIVLNTKLSTLLL